LHGLVNNAGIYQPAALMETDDALWQRHIQINQYGCFLGMKAVVPAMERSGGGSIVNISSVAGLKGSPGSFAYAATKWALRGMTKSAAIDLGVRKIRVNSVHPGPIDTDMIAFRTPGLLAFESADHPVDAWMSRALEVCRDHGGTPETDGGGDAHLEGAAGQWRNAFVRMPYARELLTPRGIINDTFETAITWDRFEAFHDSVKAATEKAIRDVTGKPGQVTCRFTHVYPDGPAPYFSFHALGQHGALLEQWQAIKDAASDVLIADGGTITHHYAVGREHRPWYDRQRPDLFAAALKATKKTLDPRGIMNPGVLIDP
jgi:FAD/FMN-containing dehydrogenase